jgi:hypothetical protein
MRRNRFRGLAGLCALVLGAAALPPAAAQSPAEGLIYYAEGAEFSISSGGTQYPYRAEDLRFLSLEKADMVQTGPQSFVEIRFLPSGLLVKVAENSSIAFDGTGEDGSNILLSLLYGRIRVISGWNGQLAPAVIRLGSTVVDIVEGDIALDNMVLPEGGGKSVPRVHSFSGSAELIPLARPAPGSLATRTRSGYVSDLPAILLEEHESLTLGSETDREALDPALLRYWNEHNFAGHSALPDPGQIGSPAPAPTPAAPASSFVSLPPVPVPPPGEFSLSPEENPFLRAYRIKQTALTVGTIFTGAAIAVEAAGYWLKRNDRDYMGDTVMLYGFIPAGLGLISLIISLMIDSPPL